MHIFLLHISHQVWKKLSVDNFKPAKQMQVLHNIVYPSQVIGNIITGNPKTFDFSQEPPKIT